MTSRRRPSWEGLRRLVNGPDELVLVLIFANYIAHSADHASEMDDTFSKHEASEATLSNATQFQNVRQFQNAAWHPRFAL